jgi:hypothetical protein
VITANRLLDPDILQIKPVEQIPRQVRTGVSVSIVWLAVALHYLPDPETGSEYDCEDNQ